MTQDDAVGRWLAPRLEQAPRELARAVIELVEEAQDGRSQPDSVPSVLAEAAMLGFDEITRGGEPVRSSALRLLAADASLTYAFEAAASLGLDVEELAHKVGITGCLGRRLSSVAGSSPDGGSL